MKVVLENLTKKFGKVVAVNNLNLEIKGGEFFILLGPSGCGKTTTIRMIAGLDTPDCGDIYMGDTRVNDLQPKDRNVAMVFQKFALYPHLSVYDNLAFPLEVRKIPKEEIRKKIQNVGEILKIPHLLDRLPSQLSGGEAQRVALGRAIVREPDVFLMDEPLSNIDAKLRAEMRVELQKLHRKLKTTTIYVTHDQVEAMTMGKRLAVMRDGSLIQVGAPNEIFRRPANLFVGGFVGAPSMNMIEGSLVKKKEGWVVDVGPFNYFISRKLGDYAKKKSTSEIVLGIRPEDIVVCKEGKSNIKGKVDVLELVGSDLYVHLNIGDKSLVMRTSPTKVFRIGKEVSVQFNKKHIYLFDKRSGKLI